MPAWRAAGAVHGTSPSIAKSTLNAPGPCRNRRYERATRSGSRSPRMSAAIDGDTSSINTSLGGRSSAEVTRTPVSIVPPCRSMTATRASAIACDPPSATTQPVGVAGGDQHQPDRAGHRPVEAGEGVRRDAGPERLGLLGLPHPRRSRSPAGARRHRSAPASADAGECAAPAGRRRRTDRRSGWPVCSNTRRHRWTVGAECIGGPVDRSVHDAGRTVVERMDTVDLGLQPGEAFGRQVEIGHDR